VSRPALEVADIFRGHGAAWRRANAGHVSLDQLKVMSAIERCRTAALGGHVARCEKCAHTVIAYNRFYEASGGERMHPSSVS
jgi:Transposase zinc-binding domain